MILIAYACSRRRTTESGNTCGEAVRGDYPDWFKPDDLPRFDMQAERLNDSFNAALFDVLLLVVYNVLFFMLSYVFFLRYDIT